MKDEERRLQEALAGDVPAFEELLRPHRQGMLSLAYKMTGDSEDAKEVCQEAMIKIYKYLPRFRPEKSFRNWIYKIVVNSAYDHLRMRKRQYSAVESQRYIARPPQSLPEEAVISREFWEKLRACLEVLTPKERRIFLLRDSEGYTVEETAHLTGSSGMSVRTHLSRARKKIRRQFEKFQSTSTKEESA